MNNIKPFYIYTDKNSLFIKNINEHTEKLATNIYSYSASIDDDNNIHICCIDLNGKLIHISNVSGVWKKKIIIKIINSVKNLKNFKLYMLKNHLNILLVEGSFLDDNIYRFSHLSITLQSYNVNRFSIKNIVKNNEFFYNLVVDEFSNLILRYIVLDSLSNQQVSSTLVFNSTSRIWSNIDGLVCNISEKNISLTSIEKDIFDYCYSLSYKI